MQIQYFGLTSFKISSKDQTLIIDPFSKDSGLTPPRGAASLVILSDANNEMYSYTQSIQGEPFMITGPGEYDVRNHAITGIPVKNKEGKYVTIYLIEVEDIKILHLAHIDKLALTEDELEDIGEVHILTVPIGGKDVMDFEEAAKAANFLEAKIVIPMHYKIPGLKITADSEDKFIKEMGGKSEKMDKLMIKKKEILPDAATKVVILDPLR